MIKIPEDPGWRWRGPAATLIFATFSCWAAFSARRMTPLTALDRSPLPPPHERLFGLPRGHHHPGPPPGPSQDPAPAAFDSKAYAAYHTSLDGQSPEELLGHYRDRGQKQRRVASRIRVLLSYDLYGGLSNQLYGHVDVLSMGLLAGAEVVLPPAYKRDNNYSDVFYSRVWPEGWSKVPQSTLLDVDHMVRWWAQWDAVIHEELPQVEGPTVQALFNVSRMIPRPMWELQTLLRKTVVRAAEEHIRQHPDEVPTVLVDMPYSMIVLDTRESHTALVTEVARHVRPAPRLQRLGGVIVDGIASAYNGLHLRLEADAGYVRRVGGIEALWGNYTAAMDELGGFNGSVPVYIASGLLTYMSPEEYNQTVTQELMGMGRCSDVVYKELFLSAEELHGLHSEALALLDMIALAGAQHVVGFSASTFSWYLREIRCLLGSPVSTFRMPAVTDLRRSRYMDPGGRLSDYHRVCSGIR